MNKGDLRNEWSDNILEEIATSKKFPKEVFDKNEFKPIISRFFYFYFTGKLSSGCSVQCTVYSAVSLLNVFDAKGCRRVFEARDYMQFEDDAKPFYKSHKHELSHFENFEKGQCFRNDITKILRKWDTVNVWNKEQAKLMRLTAFLALKLCTILIKSRKNLLSNFSSRNFRFALRDVVGWDMSRIYSTPNAESINKCAIELADEIQTIPLKSLFAIVVRQWVYSVRLHTEDKMISSLLFESLLEDTAGNGLGLITLMTSVLYLMEITFDQLLKALKKEMPALGEHQSSWINCLEFKSKFLSKDNPQYSFAWARLIGSNYLIQYSAPQNVFFCGIFATIVEIYDGPEVWRASWTSRYDPKCLSETRKVGKRIHDHLISTKD